MTRRKQRSTDKRGTRILFVVENSTVPPDTRVWREARTAARAGYNVTIIAPKGRGYSASFEVIDGIAIYRHPVLWSRGGKLGQVLEYASALVWEVAFALRAFVRHRFRLIHGANPPDHIYLIAQLFRPFGARYIFDHHDLSPELYTAKFGREGGAVHRVLKYMERRSCVVADAVISTNQSYKRHIVERCGVDPRKVFVVRNDPELRESLVVSGSERGHVEGNGRIELFYLGSTNVQDGASLLVEVMARLLLTPREQRIHCTIVGDGDDLPRIKELVKDQGLDAHFTFPGYVTDRQMIERLLSRADICLETAPSNAANDKSTFIKVMEYMAAGKPIVAFDLEETRFSTGASALLVEPGDVGGFVQAIQSLIADPGLRASLGRTGQARIESELNWGHSSQELLRAYAYALGET